MKTIIGVRFRVAGKIYYFDPVDMEILRGSRVIVETARGMEMGTVMVGNKQVEDESVVQPLKPVIRIATEEDLQIAEKNKEKEKEAFRICQEKIHKHELEMKLVDVEYTFDNNKILFYFTADGRIDFRELVKDLASVFKTRIELRQIGVRDETKILGGIGICGRPLCCHSYLSEFIPVSIKMAKEQNLSLNPTKISGVCGRLMCCLKNEEETYEYLNSRLPAQGDFVMHKGEGTKGTVHSVNVLRQTVKVIISLDGDDLEVREYPLDELTYRPRRKKSQGGKMTEEELRQLEALENEEMAPKDDYAENGESAKKEDPRSSEGHSEKHERRDKGHRNERNGRGERSSRSENHERGERSGHGNRTDNPAGEKLEVTVETEAKGEEKHPEGGAGREERRSRRERRNRRERENRSEPREQEARSAGENHSEQGSQPHAESRVNRDSHSHGENRPARGVQSNENSEDNFAEASNPHERPNRRRRDHYRGRRNSGGERNTGEGENKSNE